jgi:hypothetical protein
MILILLTVYKEQLMALGIVPSDLDSAAKAFAYLKAELEKEMEKERLPERQHRLKLTR